MPGPHGSDSTALDEEAARTTGDAAATIHAIGHTAWPYVTAMRRPADPAGRAPRAALRQPLARHVRKVRARRHPRPGKAPRTASDPDRPEDLWKALDRGEDPTREA